MGWPASVKQIFTPMGGDVQHGQWLSTCAAHGNPCRQAFEDWLGGSSAHGRHSWDPIAVMIAVRGAEGVHCKEVDQGGHNVVNEAGQERWVQGTGANQSRIAYLDGKAQVKISFELNQLLCKAPGRWISNVSKSAGAAGGWNAALGETRRYSGCFGPAHATPATSEQAPPLPPPPPPAASGYGHQCPPGRPPHQQSRSRAWLADWLVGENCYGARGGAPAHGATDLDGAGSCGSFATLAECQGRCLELRGCTAVTVQRQPDGMLACYRKADVVLGECDAGTSFDTYLRQKWSLALGANCYGGGHGAVDLDPKSGCGTMDVRACQAKCDAMPGCSAIVWRGKDHSGVGDCFRKSHIDLAACDHKTDFDTYLRATVA